MKFVPLVLLTVGLVSMPLGTTLPAAVSNVDQSAEIAALEKKLAATRDEVTALKTALVIARSQAQAAESKAQVVTRPDPEVESLRSQVRVLERDLQSATAALKRVAADKAATESALAAANQQLAATSSDPKGRRQPAAGSGAGPSNGAEQKLAELQTALTDTQNRLAAAEKNLEARAEEMEKLRAALGAAEARQAGAASETESARRALNEAEQRLASLVQELADSRQHLAAARELQSRVRELEAEKAEHLRRPVEPGVSKEDFARVVAAQTEAEGKLASAAAAYAVLAKERDELRAQAAKAVELERRVRQLEAGKANPATGGDDSTAGREELARVTAAQLDAERKLATALRSFTLLTKERDELRARVAELSAKLSGSQANP